MELLKDIVTFLALTWLICISVGWIIAMVVYNYDQKLVDNEKASGFILVTPSVRTIIMAPMFCLSMFFIGVSCVYGCVKHHASRKD